MALNFKPLQYDQEFTSLQKKHLKTSLESVAAGTIDPQDAVAELTDSTGGTPGATLAAITAPAANATTSLTNDMTAVRNSIASLNAQINSLQDALVAAGILED